MPLPPNLRDTVIGWSAQGLTSDKISDRLDVEFAVKINSRNIRKLLEAHRSELADVAKAVARDEIAKHLASCVAVFVAATNRAADVERKAMEKGKLVAALMAQRNQMHAAERLLHFAGIDQPDVPNASESTTADIAEVRASLLARIEGASATLHKLNGANGTTKAN